MQLTTLGSLKKGDFFTLKRPADENDVAERSVWIRGDYDRFSRTYDVYKFADVNWYSSMKSSRKVWTGFTF